MIFCDCLEYGVIEYAHKRVAKYKNYFSLSVRRLYGSADVVNVNIQLEPKRGAK